MLAVIESRCVEVGPVVPDSERVLLPLEAHLQVMVELRQVEEVLEDGVRLVARHTDDALREVRVNEDRLPAGNRICADDRVHGFEMVTDVSWRAPNAVAELVAKTLGYELEEARFVNGLKRLEVFCEGRGETVINLIATGPESVAASNLTIDSG